MNGSDQRRWRSGLGWVALAGLVAFTSIPVEAQTVRGQLLEQGSRRPISSGLVELIDTTDVTVAQAATDAEGRFELRAPQPGSYFIRAERIGYRTTTDGVLELGEGGLLTIDFYLRLNPIALDPLGVIAERSLVDPQLERRLIGRGYYQRQERGFGYFITPEDVVERQPFDARDLFRGIPGLQVTSGGGFAGGDAVIPRSCLRNGGSFTGWIDGMLAHRGRFAWDIELDVAIEDVVAAEVYTRLSSIPLQYTVAGTSCGVVLIWTK